MKVYTEKQKMMSTLTELDEKLAFRTKVLLELKRSMQGLTIPEIAARLNANEDDVVVALQALCVIATPRILIDNEDGEYYYQKSLELRNPNKLPAFTDTMKFYHIRSR
jgi:hypothetical protein